MKILFEGENLTDIEAQEILDNIITEDFSLLESVEEINCEYAIFSNKKSLLKAETKYNPETNLNYLRILDLQKNNVDEELLKFKVLTTKQGEDLIVTHNQIITIIEALEVYKDSLSDIKTSSVLVRARANFELNKVDIIKQYFEEITDYNHQTACENCYKGRLKKDNMMGLGESGFEQSAKKRK
ncbi:hypothetical protein [uncultured Clostridium sp.]|jgi:hypothetical protein|uniref:hypothetical protein n=1 Tax=uncultured Clostridium sp. TaxID=59620 RepID=UPI0026730D0A|nr:hypothetical protein [uncultured Clostridium sp.]